MGTCHDNDEGVRRCPECGAPLGNHERCEDLFHVALAMEWTDPPVTGAAHHLLVATYMLQHPSRFTPEGRDAYRGIVSEVVDERLTGEQLRRRMRVLADPANRDWKLTLKEPAEPVLRCWPLTVADAIDGPAEELPARVWRWGEAAREQLREDEHGA